MHFASFLPDWNSLDSVRTTHSDLELCALLGFAVLVVFDALAHIYSEKTETARRLEKLGLWFFALAVLAEIVAYPYGQRNDTLSGEIIGSLSAAAKEASTESRNALKDSVVAVTQVGVAKLDASAANDSAEQAELTAARASTMASGVAKEAVQLRQKNLETEAQLKSADAEIEHVKAQRDELEKSLAPRTLFFPSKEVLQELRAFSGTKIVIRYLPDAEAERAASMLVSLLTGEGGAGWKLAEATPDPSKNIIFFDGVVVSPWAPSGKEEQALPSSWPERVAAIHKLLDRSNRSRRTSEELVDFLISQKWIARSGPSEQSPDPDTIVITVGFKPNPYFDPAQLKQISIENEQVRQKQRDQERKLDERLKRLGNEKPQ